MRSCIAECGAVVISSDEKRLFLKTALDNFSVVDSVFFRSFKNNPDNYFILVFQ